MWLQQMNVVKIKNINHFNKIIQKHFESEGTINTSTIPDVIVITISLQIYCFNQGSRGVSRKEQELGVQ